METGNTLNKIIPLPEGTKRPLWSVMIPTFNPGKYIIEAINSIIVQDPGEDIMQIEVVDDCSTKIDLEKLVMDNWKGRVGYYRLPYNVGHSFNFTESIRRANGHLIHLLHDDDRVKPEFYKVFENILDAYPEAGAVFCRQEYIDDEGNHKFYSELEQPETGILENALVKLAEKQRIQYCSIAVRRSVFENIGGFITKNIGCEDWEMWVRIAASYPIVYEPRALADYRVHHGTSMTLKDMRSGQDMRFMTESIHIFSKYVKQEDRKEVNLKRRKYYGNYSFKNAKRLLEEFNDDEGAAAQLSETIKIDSELVYENLDFLLSLNSKVESAGVSVIVYSENNSGTIERTLRHLAIQKIPNYIPYEIIVIDNASDDNSVKIAEQTWKKYGREIPFKIIQFHRSSAFDLFDKAMKNARYNFVAFVKPGDLPERNYIRYISQNMLRANNIGMLGGYSELYENSEVPEWFEKHSSDIYQTGAQAEFTSDVTWSKGFVWDSGMVVRKDAWKNLEKKNFRSNFKQKSHDNFSNGINEEIGYALKATGWRIWYSIDLKSKKIFTPEELSRQNLRKALRRKGANSVILDSLRKINKFDINNFDDINTGIQRRKLIRRAFREIKKNKRRTLNSGVEAAENNNDITSIEFKNEFQTGRIAELLRGYKNYNRRLRALRRIAKKKDLEFISGVFGKPYFRYPQYKKSNDRRGISVILRFEKTSKERLYKSLEKISEQKINKEFRFEVILISDFADSEFKKEIYSRWDKFNCRAALRIADEAVADEDALYKAAIEKSRYDFLIFLNENTFIDRHYLRIADKVLRKYKDAGLLGGQSEMETIVKAPKWVTDRKKFYGIGKQFVKSGDVTDSGHLWKAGIIVRKEALREIYLKHRQAEENDLNKYLLPGEIIFTNKFRAAGWRIRYEERLKLKKYIGIEKLKWESARELSYSFGKQKIRDGIFSKLQSGGSDLREISRMKDTNRVLKELRKYPLKKIFSQKNEFKGSDDILEIEKLRGSLNEIFRIKKSISGFSPTGIITVNGNGQKQSNGNLNQEKTEIQKGVSVVICCYNSANVIKKTLIKIFNQRVPEEIPWEIIIVDNASTDDTSVIAQQIYDESSCLTPFKIVSEATAGLSAARKKGFEAARYEYIIFCDDDNWLEKDFVRIVYETMINDEKIGVLGGQSKAEVDIAPPKWFDEWKSSFAVGKQYETAGDITWTRGFVWGAAMVVRKSAWKKLDLIGFKSYLTDRKGKALSSGGDTEICYALRNEGYKIWYEPRLKFRHYISKDRLNWNYIRELFKGFGRASTGLDKYLKKPKREISLSKKIAIPLSRGKEIYRSVLLLRKPVYRNLLKDMNDNPGNVNIPMIDYSIGRIESLLNVSESYKRGIRLLRKNSKKYDYKILEPLLRKGRKKTLRIKKKEGQKGVSIVVCTFNGEDRLPETVKFIAKQKVKPEIPWEFILVDNASTDKTKQVVIDEWKKHKSDAELRIVDEFKQGLSAARHKGFAESNYDYIVLCDDDNLLDENFVQITYEVMSGNENIGVLGGPNEALCEAEPPVWFKWFQHGFAAGVQADLKTGNVSDGNITWLRGFVWGAGMILRKSAIMDLYSKGFTSLMSDRKGYQLSSGGDSEVCFALVLSGWEVWYDKRLKLKHCMPSGRLTWNYLIRLFQGFGITSVGLDYYEKAIKMGRIDLSIEEIEKQNWKYEFKKTLRELRKNGVKRFFGLRHSQENDTHVPMTEYYFARLTELYRVRKEYDKNFESIKKAVWKKSFQQLRASHRKFVETENDYRYGWPWKEELPPSGQDLKSYPKISILSPSFNSENTIEKAILSVLRQGYPNFEHIICDGGSTDSTLEIIKKYPHIKFVSEPDKGQCDAMNKAFGMSSGEIISYLNVDDYYQRGAFRKIAKAFEENPGAEMIVGNLFFENDGHTFIRNPEIEYKKIIQPFKYIFPINPVSYFYKRKVQEEIGPFPLDDHYTMDYWFLLNAYQKYKLAKINEFLGTFCMNGFNKTSGADNRKNVHRKVVEHCRQNDRKNLLFYLYSYYKHYYYDDTVYNPKKIKNKFKRNAGRIVSIITLKKNRYYAEKLFQRSRSNYYLGKRTKGVSILASSFVIYPKGIRSRSRQSLMLYSILGNKKTEKIKIAYNFFTTPPGLPLANKLHYYGREFKNENKKLKGKSLLFLTFVVSPNFYIKQSRQSDKGNLISYLNPLNLSKDFVNFFRYRRYKNSSNAFFEKAGSKYFENKNSQAVFLMVMAFLCNPASIRKRSRQNLFAYSAFGNKSADKMLFIYHLYKDNPEYSFAHKLNYFGNELRRGEHAAKGNLYLLAASILSPKYFFKREKIKKQNIVYVSNIMETKKSFSLNPLNWAKAGVRKIRNYRNSHESIGTRLSNGFEMFKFRMKTAYYYFRYRKFKAQSKEYYGKAQEYYNSGRRFDPVMLIFMSFIFYPLSIGNKNKWSIIYNSALGNSLKGKIKKVFSK